MSTTIMSKCWPIQGLSIAQKAVLISLADQANDDGVCWPAIKTIAKRCCMSERAVRCALDYLEEVGLVKRDRRFNTSSYYTISTDADMPAKPPTAGARKTAKASPPEPDAGGAGNAGGAADAGGGAADAGGGAAGAGLGLHGVPPNRKGSVTEPKKEPSLPAVVPAGQVPVVEDQESAMQAACRATWASYCEAYSTRYGAKPVRNARVNAGIRQLVQRLGHQEAPEVAAWYLRVNDSRVVAEMHAIGLLLARAEAYRTQWYTGQTMTAGRARQLDQTQTNLSAAEEAIQMMRERNARRRA